MKDKFKFPGGGTQFIHGADEYLDHINKVIIFLFIIIFLNSGMESRNWVLYLVFNVKISHLYV